MMSRHALKAPDWSLKWMERVVWPLEHGQGRFPRQPAHVNQPVTGAAFDPLPRPLLQPAPDFGADDGGIVQRLVAPVVQFAGERPDDPGLLQGAVEGLELGRSAVQLDDVDRLAGGAGLRHHRHAVARDDDHIGQRQEGEVGVLALAVPDDRRHVGHARPQDRLVVGAGPARRGDQQAGAVLLGEIGQLFRHVAHDDRRHAEHLVGAADQHRDPGMGQVLVGRPHPRRGIRQLFRRDQVQRAARRDDVGAAQAIVLRHHDEVQQPGRDLRVLQMHREGLAPAGAPYAKGRRHGGTAATDQQVGPGRLQRVAAGCGGVPGPKPEERAELPPRRAQGHSLDDRSYPDRLCQSDALVFHAGLAVADNPAG